MKARINMCGSNVRGFSLECGTVETLILNRALRQFIKDPLGDNCDADKLIAKKMAEELMNAKEDEEDGR